MLEFVKRWRKGNTMEATVAVKEKQQRLTVGKDGIQRKMYLSINKKFKNRFAPTVKATNISFT